MKKSSLGLLIAINCLFVACEQSDISKPIESEAEAAGSLLDIDVQQSGVWSAESNEIWCIPASSCGYGETTLQVTLMPNLTGKKRQATVTITSQTENAANAPRTKAATGNNTATYVFTQEPATITEAACQITGLKCTPEQVIVYLTVTGTDEGLFKSVDGLSNKPSSGGNVLLPPAANIPIGTDGTSYAVIVGDDCSYGAWAYGVTGWEGREMELTLYTEPACTKKVYFDQSEMLYPINTDENATTCGGSAQIRFAVNGKIYFGGGYSARGSQNSVMGNSQAWGTPCTDLTKYDPATNTLTACKPLPENLVYGSAAVVDGKAYVASFAGDVYEYDPQNDTWNTSGINVGRCDAMYSLGGNLCVVNNVNGIVSRYSVSGTPMGNDTYPKGNVVVALAETPNRAWLMVDNALYLHDAQGLRQVTTLATNGLVTAYNGQVYYFVSNEGVVNAYNPTTNTHTRVPMSLFTAGVPGVDTFHSGLPVVADDGVGYLCNCGYSRWGDLTWNGAQTKKVMRIDMRHSYKVIVK